MKTVSTAIGMMVLSAVLARAAAPLTEGDVISLTAPNGSNAGGVNTFNGYFVLGSASPSTATTESVNDLAYGNTNTITGAVNSKDVATGVTIVEHATDSITGDNASEGNFDPQLLETVFGSTTLYDHPTDTSTIDYTGLTAGMYDLVLYTNNYSGGRGFDVTTTGANSMEEALIGDPATSLVSTAVGTQAGLVTYDGNYIELTGVEVGTDGNLDLVISESAQNSYQFNVSAVQLELTPEPGTVAMMALGIGGLAFLVYRRRAGVDLL